MQVRLSNDDRAALSTIRALLDVMMPAGSAGVGGQGGMMYGATRAMRAGQDIVPMLPELMPGLQVCGCGWPRRCRQARTLHLLLDEGWWWLQVSNL